MALRGGLTPAPNGYRVPERSRRQTLQPAATGLVGWRPVKRAVGGTVNTLVDTVEDMVNGVADAAEDLTEKVRPNQ